MAKHPEAKEKSRNEAHENSAEESRRKAAEEAARLAREAAEKKAREAAERREREAAEKSRQDAARIEKGEHGRLSGKSSVRIISAPSVDRGGEFEFSRGTSPESKKVSKVASKHLSPAAGEGDSDRASDKPDNSSKDKSNGARPTDEFIKATAAKLREDLHVDKWLIDPRNGDGDKVSKTLSALPRDVETMQRLREAYAQSPEHKGADLISDIKNRLPERESENLKASILAPESQFARLEIARQKVESAGNKKFLGGLPDALKDSLRILNPALGAMPQTAETEISRDEIAARRELREQLSVMNSRDIRRADEECYQKYGMRLTERLFYTPGMRKEDDAALGILLAGADTRAKHPELNERLAEFAVKNKDLDMLRESLGNSPEARALFQKSEYSRRLQGSFADEDLQVARDIVESGETQLSSQIRFNRGLFGADKEGVEQAINVLSSEQREMLRRGRELNEGTSCPPNLSEPDKNAILAYSRMQSALKDNFGERDARSMEARVFYGTDNLISRLASSHSDGFFGVGAGHDRRRVYDLVDRELSRDDFERLKSDKTFRKDLTESLKVYLSGEEIGKVENIIERKLKATGFEDSRGLGRSTLERIQDLNSGSSDDSQRATAIKDLLSMSKEEQSHFIADSGYRARLEKGVNELFGDSETKEIAGKLLAKIEAGQSPELGAVEKIQLSGLSKAKTADIIEGIESFLHDDPAAVERLKNPRNEEDKRLKQILERELSSAVLRSPAHFYDNEGNSNFSDLYKQLHSQLFEKGGKVPLVDRLEHVEREMDVFHQLTRVSSEDRNLLLMKEPLSAEAKETQLRVFGRLGADGAALAREIVKSGKMDDLSLLRASAVSSEGLNKDETERIKSIFAAQKNGANSISDAYAKRYGESITKILDRIPQEEQSEFRSLLSRGKRNSAEDIQTLAEERARNESGLLGGINFGDKYTAVESSAEYRQRLERASAGFETLPVEEQSRLLRNAQNSLADWSKARHETADAATDGAIIVGSLAATVATGGGASPLLIAAVGGAGGVAKVAGKELLLADQYDALNGKTVAGDATHGFVLAAGSMVGPEHLASVFKVGDRIGTELSGQIVQNMVEKSGRSFLKEGGEEILQNGLQNAFRNSISQGRSEVSAAAIKELSSRVALPGFEDGVEQVIRSTLIKSPLQLSERLLTEIALNSAAGSAANASGAAAEGLIKWDPDLSSGDNAARISTTTAEAALSGALFSAGATMALKPLAYGLQRVGREIDYSSVPISFGDDFRGSYREQLATLKDSLKISSEDSRELQRAKLLEYFQSGQGRAAIKLLPDTIGFVAHEGSAALRYARELDLPETLIPVLDSSSGKETSLFYSKLGWIADNRHNPDNAFQISLRKGEAPHILNSSGKVTLRDGESIELLQRTDVKPEFARLSPAQLKEKFEELGISRDGEVDFWAFRDQVTSRDLRIFIGSRISGHTSTYFPAEEFSQAHQVKYKPDVKSGASVHSAPAASSYLSELKLWSFEKATPLTPAVLAADLSELPDGGRMIRRIVVDNRPSFTDPFNSVRWFDKENARPFVGAASMDGTGEMNFYPAPSNNLDSVRRNNVRHEWSHALEGESTYRLRYDAAVELERRLESPDSRVYLRDYASYNEHENWAVHIGEAYMADSDDIFREKLLAKAKDKAGQIKELLHAKALEEALLTGREQGHVSPRYDLLMRRSLEAQQVLAPGARAKLNELLSTANYNTEVQRMALRLYKDVFGEHAAENLLKLNPENIHDRFRLMNAISEAYNYEIPESYLVNQIENNSPLAAEALSHLTQLSYLSEAYPGSIPLIENKLRDGSFGRLYAESPDSSLAGAFADYLSSHIDSAEERMRLVELNLRSVEGDSHAQANLLRCLIEHFSMFKESDGEVARLIQWAEANMQRSSELEKVLAKVGRQEDEIGKAARELLDSFSRTQDAVDGAG